MSRDIKGYWNIPESDGKTECQAAGAVIFVGGFAAAEICMKVREREREVKRD